MTGRHFNRGAYRPKYPPSCGQRVSVRRVGRQLEVAVCTDGPTIGNPARILAEAWEHAFDPIRAPSRVERLSEMSPEKREEMERLYGKGTP